MLHLKIADLITEIPAAESLALRCRDYLVPGGAEPDVVIRPELYHYPDGSIPCEPGYDVEYMESGFQFYWQLLRFEGMMLHASAVALDGWAYLFSGPCGRGKSTHTRQWQAAFGPRASVFNDDKPALRRLDGKWYAYGTPWCGKDGINKNEKWPLAGICFLEQAQENRIRRLSPAEAIPLVLEQTLRRLQPKSMERLLTLLDQLLREVPVYLLENRPEPDAARLSFEAMRPR